MLTRLLIPEEASWMLEIESSSDHLVRPLILYRCGNWSSKCSIGFSLPPLPAYLRPFSSFFSFALVSETYPSLSFFQVFAILLLLLRNVLSLSLLLPLLCLAVLLILNVFFWQVSVTPVNSAAPAYLFLRLWTSPSGACLTLYCSDSQLQKKEGFSLPPTGCLW